MLLKPPASWWVEILLFHILYKYDLERTFLIDSNTHVRAKCQGHVLN